MNRLSPRIPRAPVHHAWLSPARDRHSLLCEVREHARLGYRVHVTRAGGGAFEVVANGSCFMVRTLDGDAVGTWDDPAAALAGGLAHLDQPPPEDDSDDFLPRGAA